MNYSACESTHSGLGVVRDADGVSSNQSHHLLRRESYGCKLSNLGWCVFGGQVWHPIEVRICDDGISAPHR